MRGDQDSLRDSLWDGLRDSLRGSDGSQGPGSSEHWLDRPLSRRGLLRGGATLGAAMALGGLAAPAAAATRRSGASPDWVDGELFTLGVASGDPSPDGVVLWTRLAPDPLVPGGGMDPQPVEVQWQVACDERFRRVVARGRVYTGPDSAATVRVRVRGLEPHRWYWYRFRVGGHLSPIGRTRTAPAWHGRTGPLKFAFASCQSYSSGYYTAHRHLADEDLDLVVFLGDYIYEGGGSGVRAHVPAAEIRTLDDYRIRHALYKSDPDLQLAHAHFPWALVWDDHEVENNYAGLASESPEETPDFAARRADAYRAYWEHQPLRVAPPTGPYMRIYRRLPYGRLAVFHLLDGRQYRSDQVCGMAEDLGPICSDALDPAHTMLGAEQEAWLADGLQRSHADWNVLANQVVFGALHLPAGLYNLDQWDGYPVARQRLLDALVTSGAANPVVITGDIHIAGAGDVKASFDDLGSPVIGSEYVATSIASNFEEDYIPLIRAALDTDPRNAHIRYFDDLSRRGYVRCHVTTQELRADYRYVSTVAEPTATVSTGASFVTEAGNPGVQPA